MFWLIGKNHVESTPEPGPKAGKPQRKSKDYTQWDKVSERFGLEETRKSIPFHSLKDIVFRVIKDFWVITTFFLNCLDDSVESGVREDDLPFRAGKNECV